MSFKQHFIPAETIHMTPILEIKSLSKSYNDDTNAVNNISLSVHPGEIYGFIGHNGAGKSTTIKSVVGILPVTQGDILINGVSVKQNLTEVQKHLAYIPDSPEIFGFMTGISYLNFIADIYGMGDEERTRQIKKYADLFSITPHLGNIIQSYSHGMKQKIVLISAFMHNPQLLVLDEPFVGLDTKASSVLKSCMKKLCSNGSAIFFSTHVLEVAEKLCTSVGIMNHGNLVVSDTMEHILAEKSLEQLFLEQIRDANE